MATLASLALPWMGVAPLAWLAVRVQDFVFHCSAEKVFCGTMWTGAHTDVSFMFWVIARCGSVSRAADVLGPNPVSRYLIVKHHRHTPHMFTHTSTHTQVCTRVYTRVYTCVVYRW